MKCKTNSITAFMLGIMFLSFLFSSGIGFAAQNQIARINQTNGTATAVSLVQITDSMNITGTVTYRVRLNITLVNTSSALNITWSLFDQSTININSTNLTNMSGQQIFFASNWTNSSDARWEVNFSTDVGLIENTSQIYNLTFTTASNATTTRNLSQRYAGQILIAMRNSAELNLINVYRRPIVSYFDWLDNTSSQLIVVWECGTDSNCGANTGNATGKTRIIARLEQNNASNVISFADANLTLSQETFYAIEGTIPSGAYDEDVDGVTILPISTGILPSSNINPTSYEAVSASRNFFGIMLPFDAIWMWVIIMLLIIAVIAIVYKM